MVKIIIEQPFNAATSVRLQSHEFSNLLMAEKGQEALKKAMDFKISERKSDPERRQGLHGPYEELMLLREGRLPSDYYDEAENSPWGLRVAESRSNILWQVLSGMMDHRPEFAAAYMGLALDMSLDADTYANELSGLHKNWSEYHQKSGLFGSHHHKAHRAMKHQYQSVACPACSVLTAMVCQDEGMSTLFKKLIPLTPDERNHFMTEQGFGALLYVMLPEPKILNEHNL